MHEQALHHARIGTTLGRLRAIRVEVASRWNHCDDRQVTMDPAAAEVTALARSLVAHGDPVRAA
jgi:hypothetical protein